MRRLLVIAAVLAIGGYALLTTGAGGGGDNPKYKVVLDNAFGLTLGADIKVAGVRAGKITGLDVQRGTNRAVVTISVTRSGFGAFRSDVFCAIQPQSLIGEYFIDCQPGTRGSELPNGATIPVERTATTIPADTVGNILRLPYRQRLSLILTELGVGLAARGEDLNATIRRAVPALRETDRVLRILGANAQTLNQLTRDSDTVLAALAANRTNVSRFVAEARDTAAISASRSTELAGTIRRLPEFLRQLRPTLRDLGIAAADQTPALRDLRISAPSLTTFLRRLGPFANSARPAIRSLGSASVIGRRTAVNAQPTVSLLNQFASGTPELSQNLRIVLQDLDNRDRAVEPDVDSPGGRGYTGLEALLQYPMDQSLAFNIFDTRGYLLKLNALLNNCNKYTNATTARADPARTQACSGGLGPNQPNVTTPNVGASRAAVASARDQATAEEAVALSQSPPAPAAQGPPGPAGAPTTQRGQGRGAAPSALPGILADVLGTTTRRVTAAIGARSPAAQGSDSAQLLDFLLAP